jgi:hypothetical protein
MHKVSGIHWPSESGLNAALQQEPLRLNPQPVSPDLTRLKMLHSDTIGGVLLLTTHYSADGTVSDPYITIIAAPSCITLGHFSAADPPGIEYADFWDDSILEHYNNLLSAGLHCPVIAATEGFSRMIKLPGSANFVTNSQPMFIPSGEHLAGQVPTGIHH